MLITKFINKHYKQNYIIIRGITFHKTSGKVNYDLRILQREACHFHHFGRDGKTCRNEAGNCFLPEDSNTLSFVERLCCARQIFYSNFFITCYGKKSINYLHTKSHIC